MPSFEHTAVLPASQKRVWDFVTAVGYWPLWLSGVSEVRAISAATAGAGTTFEVERTGQHQRDHWIVADWEPPRRVRFTDYHADIQLIFEVASAGRDSQLRAAVDWPRARGPLGRLFASNSPGGRWAGQVPASLIQLREIFVSNRDIKLLHGMGDE